MTALLLAMDKSMRTVDRFGKMHVKVSNISKACVNPYRGSEIPGHQMLGLDPDRVYMLLRHPDELVKAADTFNNLPILDRHIPVTADKPSREFIVGTTGTDAAFSDPFLRNSLSLWDAIAIAGVNTGEQRELSSAYSYDADMTPGNYEGVPYDGIMRNIKGNHVALVPSGRAGPDVIVGDSKLLEKPKMSLKKLSANAKLLHVALMAALPPVLAQDAQIGDLTAIVGSVKSLKTAKQKKAVIDAIQKQFGDKLAQDAEMPDLAEIIDVIAADEMDPGIDPVPDANDEDDVDPETEPKPGAKAKPKAKEAIDKPAMDAAIADAVAKTRTETVAHMNALHAAVRDVEPHIGVLAVAQDSAEAVYKLALDAAKIDLNGVHPSAYKAMVGMLPKSGDTPAKTRTDIAQDSKMGGSSFGEFFPSAGKMKGGV